MYTPEELQNLMELMGLLNEATSQEELFSLICGKIGSLIRNSSAVYIPFDPQSPQDCFNPELILTHDPQVLIQYAVSEDCIDPSPLGKSKTNQGSSPQNPDCFCLAVKFACQADPVGILGIRQENEMGPFDIRERTLINILVPRIAVLLHRFAFLEQLDHFSKSKTGVLVLEEPGNRLLYSNLAAARILGEGAPSNLFSLADDRHPPFLRTPTGTYRLRSFSLSTSFLESLSQRLQMISGPCQTTPIRIVLLDALSEVCSLRCRLDEEDLSPRQRDVACLVIEGHSNRQISVKLRITEQTVKAHLHDIFEKLGLRSRSELIAHFSDKQSSTDLES